ncbi:NlpC/P60 family protein [Neisseria sp. Ec49-e6-T10]|uniref:NlpC/P60 family protein n=1 Tax=Neisseria sp. Ec49-e6-T10 TaxID=3140744 RepID=UPI003EB82DB4
MDIIHAIASVQQSDKGSFSSGVGGSMVLGNMAVNHAKYGPMRYGQYDVNGQRTMGRNNLIDCSGLVTKVLQDNNYAIPTQNTLSMANRNNPYFERVSPEEVRPGDIVVWRFKRSSNSAEEGHTGFVKSFNKQTGEITYYGSQSSNGRNQKSGVAIASNRSGVLKGKTPIFIRPRSQYKKS